MTWHGLKILYALSAFCGIMAYMFLANGWYGMGSGFLFLAVYWFGCGVDDGKEGTK